MYRRVYDIFQHAERQTCVVQVSRSTVLQGYGTGMSLLAPSLTLRLRDCSASSTCWRVLVLRQALGVDIIFIILNRTCIIALYSAYRACTPGSVWMMILVHLVHWARATRLYNVVPLWRSKWWCYSWRLGRASLKLSCDRTVMSSRYQKQQAD